MEASVLARIVFFGLAIFFFFWGTSRAESLALPSPQPYLVIADFH